MRRIIPTVPVICSGCEKELKGSECSDGFRVRAHRHPLSGKVCPGSLRTDHQPVVVFRRDTLEGIVRRNFERIVGLT